MLDHRSTAVDHGGDRQSTTVADGRPPLTVVEPPLTTTGPPVNGALELMLPRSLKKNTKCFNAAGEELSAVKLKLMLLVYCC
nr:hypothetical protein [Tanacetum cinerariifolium]